MNKKSRSMHPHTVENIVKVALALSLLLFTKFGLNGYLDIDQRFFVLAVGVDKGTEDEPYEVTLKLSVPQAHQSANENEFLLLTKRARSIAGAVAYLKAKAGKEFDFGQMRAIFIGEELVKEPWLTTLDWFFRRRDIQNTAYVAVARPNAKAVLNTRPKNERIPAHTFLLAFSVEGTESPYIVTTYLFDLHRKLFERGIDPVVSIIHGLGENHFEIRDSYVVTKSEAKVKLNPVETGLLNIFLQRSERATLSLDDGKGPPFAITADEINLAYSIRMKPRPTITIKGDFYAQMEEASERVEADELARFEQRMEDHINSQMMKLLKKLQKERVDPLGFGLRYRAMHMNEKREWEEWERLYPNIRFHSDVRVRLNGTGTIK